MDWNLLLGSWLGSPWLGFGELETRIVQLCVRSIVHCKLGAEFRPSWNGHLLVTCCIFPAGRMATWLKDLPLRGTRIPPSSSLSSGVVGYPDCPTTLPLPTCGGMLTGWAAMRSGTTVRLGWGIFCYFFFYFSLLLIRNPTQTCKCIFLFFFPPFLALLFFLSFWSLNPGTNWIFFLFSLFFSRTSRS